MHFPMSIQPSAKEVLIVGGSPAVIREFLKYPIEQIDFVEIDPVMIKVSKELLKEAKVSGKKIDLVVLDVLIPSDEEQRKRYWHQRCEKISRTWIHVYCALVLLVRYNELPTESNVPVVRGLETHSYPHWHLPPEFIQTFTKAYE